jgi:cytochrome P450
VADDDLWLQPEMQALTLRIIVATLFGARSHFDEVCRVAGALLEHARSPLLLVPALQRDLGPLTGWRRFQALSGELDALLAPIIAERRAAPSDHDLLGQLVSARDDLGEPLTDRQLRDELVTLLVAGHETTASALAWTLQHVLRDEVLRRRLDDELSAVVGDGPVRNEHLERLPLLGATIDEGMRLNPVLAHVGRELTVPMTVGGYELPAGCMVVPNIYLAHRDPAIFPEPTRFDPDRFLATRHGPHAYLPFGGGARRCIGMGFALQEMKIVIATVLRRTRLALVTLDVTSVRRRGVVWAPAGGVPVTQKAPPRPTQETYP